MNPTLSDRIANRTLVEEGPFRIVQLDISGQYIPFVVEGPLDNHNLMLMHDAIVTACQDLSINSCFVIDLNREEIEVTLSDPSQKRPRDEKYFRSGGCTEINISTFQTISLIKENIEKAHKDPFALIKVVTDDRDTRNLIVAYDPPWSIAPSLASLS